MMRLRVLFLFTAALFLQPLAQAQAPGTGIYPFGSYDGRGFDSINLGNLNTHFEIPIFSKKGRAGFDFGYSIVYDGLIWAPVTSSGSTTWVPDSGWGFHGALGTGASGYLTYSQQPLGCPLPPATPTSQGIKYSFYTYHDPSGGSHLFNYSKVVCSGTTTETGDGSTSDGSGYYYSSGSVHNRNGGVVNAPVNPTSIGNTGGISADANGNSITNNGSGVFTDSLGKTVLTITGSATPSSPLLLTYPVTLQSDGATTATATMTYSTQTVEPNFQCSGIGDPGATLQNLVSQIKLADGSIYNFTYEPTPGNSAHVTGRLASISLPSGGTISYTYFNGCHGMVSDGTIAALTRTTSDGSRTYGRAANGTNAWYTNYLNEASNLSTYYFSFVNGAPYETHRQIFQGSTPGTALLDQYTCYNGAQPSCDGAAIGFPITSQTIVSSHNGGAQSAVINNFNSSGLLTSSITQATWNGGTTTKTSYSYGAQNALTSVTTNDGSNNFVAQTYYDVDANGNRIASHVQTGSSTLYTLMTVGSNGVVTGVTFNGQTTHYGYDLTNGFVTSTTLPAVPSGVSLSSGASYDSTSGALLSITGANGSAETTTINQTDRLLRPTQVTSPNGLVTQYKFSFTETDTSAGSRMVTRYDPYGRITSVLKYNGLTQQYIQYYQTDYCYNSMGLLQFRSVSYMSSGSGSYHCSGSGTSYSYDALGRTSGVTKPDGSYANYQYFSNATQISTSGGHNRIIQKDGLGRTIKICELSTASGSGPCGTDIAGTGFLTTYSYDLANHKTTINQSGQTRIFQTDAAGRTIYTSEPERGETSYSYSYNATGLVVVRTRPRQNQQSSSVKVHTTTQYDSLGRVVSVSYDDGSPGKTYSYDQTTSWSGNSLGYSKGKLTTVNGGGKTQFTYDIAGNVIKTGQCLPDWCGTSSHDVFRNYGYDLLGRTTSITYDDHSSTYGLNYTYNAAGQVMSLSGGQNNAVAGPNIWSVGQSGGVPLVGPTGPTGIQFGNALTEALTYDSSNRLNGVWLCNNGSMSSSCGTGSYLFGAWAQFSGKQVQWSCDSTRSTGCNNYGYDEFGRLSNNDSYGTHIADYGYDALGNRKTQNSAQGYNSSFLFNANNQITNSGFSYDAAGNLLTDGVHTYSYDPEGNLISVDGGVTASYTYDVSNHRVKAVESGVTERYSFDLKGRRANSWHDGSTAMDSAQYYVGKKPVAFWSASDSAIHFQHQDWLGTERVRTGWTGQLDVSFTSQPFGDGLSSSGLYNHDQDQYHFAALDHDASSNTEHAQFRQYSSTHGRWMSPDPYDGSYKFKDPQSFNRYTYARNNPLRLIDPLGQMLAACDGYYDDYSFCDDGGGGGGGSDPDDSCEESDGCYSVTTTPDEPVDGEDPPSEDPPQLPSNPGGSNPNHNPTTQNPPSSTNPPSTTPIVPATPTNPPTSGTSTNPPKSGDSGNPATPGTPAPKPDPSTTAPKSNPAPITTPHYVSDTTFICNDLAAGGSTFKKYAEQDAKIARDDGEITLVAPAAAPVTVPAASIFAFATVVDDLVSTAELFVFHAIGCTQAHP